jgi:hypothetical protein
MTILSEGLKHHIDADKPLNKHLYRTGSRAYFNLFAEARSLYSRGILEFTNKKDLSLLTETNLGHFGMFEGKKVPLDFPMLNESTEKEWNAIDVSRKAEKEIDNKEWNSRTTKKLAMLKSLNSSGKFKKDFDEDRLQGWVDQNYSWEKLARQFKLNESYSSMYEDVQDEGSCGYGPDGKPGNTPGETRGMPADTRTMTMMREVIKNEIQKLSEEGSLEDKLKGAFSPEEMDKINSKQVPGFADLKPEPKERKSKFKKAGEQMGFDMRGLK